MPPTETVEAACRAWWDATDQTGKRIATMSWDEYVARAKLENAPPCYQTSIDDYRRRMIFALQAAVGLP
jgi:hypothetical protein